MSSWKLWRLHGCLVGGWSLATWESSHQGDCRYGRSSTGQGGYISFSKRIWKSVFDHVFPPLVPLWSQKLGTWKSRKSHRNEPRSHAQTCYRRYGVPPPSVDCWESLLAREHTPETPRRKGRTAAVVSLRRAGTQRKPSPLSSHCSGGVNLSGICSGIRWESTRPCRVYWPAHSALGEDDISDVLAIRPPQSEDASPTKSISCLSLFGDEHIRRVLSSVWPNRRPGSKASLKYAFSRANMRMFGNFSRRVVVTSGFASGQGSANNKTEATK